MTCLYPLGLPKGSVRALYALLGLGGAIGLYYITGNVPDWLIAIVGMSAAWYFKTRDEK